jgi:putative oxidoreductase
MIAPETVEHPVPLPQREATAIDRPAVAWSLFFLRVIVGIIFMAHGAQKMFGWFDGPGLETMMQGPNGPIIGFLVSFGEFFGGLGILVGFLSRFSAAALIVIMLGAIAQVHGPNGFFLSNKGFEYNLALIGMLLPVLIAGPGPLTALRMLGLRRISATVE